MAERVIDVGTIGNQEMIIEKLGNTEDTGGDVQKGTLNAKANRIIAQNNGLSNDVAGITEMLTGHATPYGLGVYGDAVYSPDDFAWPSQDLFGRYIIQTKSLVIPEGITMTPPENCDGIYILSQGDVTINGNIDISGKRKTFDAVIAISPTVNVGDQTFELAKGGYSPIGGANGTAIGYWSDGYNGKSGNVSSPVITPTFSVAGNVNGGGISTYGVNKTASSVYGHNHADEDNTPYSTANAGTSGIAYGTGTGALIIIAKGTVTINGNILASATDGVNAGAGTSPARVSSWDGVTGLGGNGAIAPSGGGAVTIICNTFTNNGKIDTNGKSFTSPDGVSKATETHNTYGSGKCYGGSGGKGGTFISTAGEIKVYTGVNVE